MTRTDLTQKIYRDFNEISADDIEHTVKIILDSMGCALAHGERIEIRGFGSFEIRTRKPRLARNPKTGKDIVVPASHIPHFKPGKQLRDAIKDKVAT